MSSDSDEQPPPVKRQRYRQISIPPSSDESDSPVPRIRKRQVVPKRTASLEAAGTSAHVNGSNGNAERSSNGAIPPADAENRLAPENRSKSSKSVKVVEKKKEDTATSSKDVAESDASDVHGEQCPICLIAFVNQEVASPSSCEHLFCFPCLMEWSKNENTCPVDRKTFDVIDVRPKFGGKVERRIPVTVNTNGDEDETDLGDVDYSDDDIELRIIGSPLLARFSHIAFPRPALFSSNSPLSFSSDVLNTSSESVGYSSGEPVENESAPSSTDCDEPSSPPVVIELSSENEAIPEPSSPSEDREVSSPDYRRQSSTASDNQEPLSPSDNQRSSSPSADQHYSSAGDSPLLNEPISSPSVKNETSSASESEQQASSVSENERYSYPSEKDESPSFSEDERFTDYDSDPYVSSASS